MALFLHLSDLHLGPLEADAVIGDYKQELVPLEDRTNRQDLLRSTLGELGRYLHDHALGLDAIIVTGDITLADDQRGYQALPGLLAELGTICPPPDHIVAVPGNHDVTWKTLPGSPERYTNFVRFIRAQGYVTPALEGVDLSREGAFTDDPSSHYLLDAAAGWMILPINSANYSGMLEPLKEIDDATWADITRDPIVKRELDSLRLHDVARISDAQLFALHTMLRDARERLRGSGHDPDHTLRLAAIHHHLLPVTTVEEFKPYESITNLGLLRHFLKEQRIHVVLHGHKHADLIYRDHIYDLSAIPGKPTHDVLVLSGATIGTGDYRRSEVCRLLRVERTGSAIRLSVAPIAATAPGAPLTPPSWRRLSVPAFGPVQQPGGRSATIVYGDTASEVYDRVLLLFDDLSADSTVPNLVCNVARGIGADHLPSMYPDIPGISGNEERDRWFEDLVAWWQRPKSILADRLRFTHGGRIYQYGGRLDQVEQAVEALRSKEDSSRGVVVLIDPIDDEIGNTSRKFPAFCLVQLLIRRRAPGGRQLDCVGYFRKQEMKYWWPVNVAELAGIQRKVFERLSGHYRDLAIGHITTFAAVAFAGTTVPRVAVPAVDRAIDENPQLLSSMVYALFWPEMPDRSHFLDEWKRLLEDLKPPEQRDPDGVPVAINGIQFLMQQILTFGPHRAEAVGLSESLRRLHELNSKYVEESALDVTPERHQLWRNQALGVLKEIEERINTLAG